MKTCTNCNLEKPASEFGKLSANKRDGLRNQCKACESEKYKVWRAANKEKEQERQRKWREDNAEYFRTWREKNKERQSELAKEWAALNPGKMSEKAKRYYDNHVDVCKEKALQYREANPGKVKAAQKAWLKNNPERARALRQKRRALKKGAIGAISGEELEMLISTQKVCICGVEFSKHRATIEHIIPLSRGGTNNLDNLMLLCPSCNSRKKDKTPDEFVEYLGKIGREDELEAYVTTLEIRRDNGTTSI